MSTKKHIYLNIIIAIIVGIGAWGVAEPGYFQVLSIIAPALWFGMPNRWIAGTVYSVYTLAASYGLISGMAVYFDIPVLLSLLMWLIAATPIFTASAILWHKNRYVRLCLIPVLLLVTSIPPIGLFGWANPVTAAGWLFPGWAWYGLLSAVVLILIIAWFQSYFMYSGIVFSVCIAAILLQPNTMQIPAWKGYNTSFEYGAKSHAKRDLKEEFSRHKKLQRILNTGFEYHLYPESVGGVWNDFASSDWQEKIKESGTKGVLLGSHEQLKNGYNNVVVAIDDEGARIVYRQRVPAPVGMWNPWSKDSAKAYWFDESVVDVAGHRLGFLMCYESLLVFPVIQTLLNKPDALVSMASTWWAPLSIHYAQKNSVHSWARLFNLPVVEAYNL